MHVFIFSRFNHATFLGLFRKQKYLKMRPFKSKNEFEAFQAVYSSLKERLPTTVWIFESGDSLVLVQPDLRHAEESLPPNNLHHYDVDVDGVNAKMISVPASKSYQRLLQHVLIVRRYRLSIYRFQNGSFVPTLHSPCNFSEEVEKLMFGTEDDQDNDGRMTDKMLTMGPICSIVIEGDAKAPRVGICFWHDTTKTMKVAEFHDNLACDKLESLLVQYGPMEAVHVDQPKYQTVKKMLKRSGILSTHFVAKKGAKIRPETDFFDSHIDEKKVAAKALNNLHQHLNMDFDMDKKSIKEIQIQSFVQMNRQAVSGLNIFETEKQSMSLFKVLNKTRTRGGERLLRVWLCQPLTDKGKIQERLSIVEEFVNDSGARKMLHDNLLRRIPDFQSLSVKLENKKATLQDLYKCYMGAREIRRLGASLEEMNSALIKETYTVPISSKLDMVDKFVELVEATLDMDAIASDNIFAVKAEFDETLMKIGTEKAKIRSDIDNALTVVVRYLGLEQKNVKLEFTNQHGFTYRVTMKDEKFLRKKQSELMIVDTNKAGVRFRDRKLDQLNRAFLAANAEFEEQQKMILSEMSEITSGYAAIFNDMGQITSQLDCLVGFAVAAVTAPVPYCKPTISEESDCISLNEARHPCLEIIDDTNFIPNSIDFKDGKCFCIITGPNLGGKSTFLRTVALNVLMAQIGSFVACQDAIISPRDRIFVRIGAGDHQLQGISTFMSEMLEAAHIMRSSTPRSLILIDELGRGTSTYDGLGLAWAISEKIALTIKAPTLFATHFHEITRLAEQHPKCVFNCHVSAVTSDDQFTLLYKLNQGSSNQSFGLEVARLAGFPSEVLTDAQVFLEKAELPMLRHSNILSDQDIASFLSQYSETNDKKRKQDLVDEMKCKVFKAK